MLKSKTASRRNSTEVSAAAVLIICAIIACSLPARAQRSLDSGQLFSPSVGQKLYEIAHELANSKDLTERQVDQAIILLAATNNLDRRANYVLPDMIKLASRNPAWDYSKLVYNLLAAYIDKSADLEVVTPAVRYLLERLDSREERERLLEDLLANMGGKNAALDSELATLLGLLMAEKTDMESAQLHLMRALNSNSYNKLAFAKLAELAPEQLQPPAYLQHLRLALSENPFDIEAAVSFALYAQRLQLYETAADAYQYCAELFNYLYPAEELPASLYLPWAISSYNTKRNQHRCLRIANDVRQSGRFDLFLEAIAAKAAAKIGDTEQQIQILQTAEAETQRLLFMDMGFQMEDDAPEASDRSSQQITPDQLAWFYCFALPDADRAIDWANKAYSVDPNSGTVAAILAYSLMMDGQADWAKLIIDNYQHNQIADLTLAQIQLAHGKRDLAIQTLKLAIDKDPGSLEAERAKEILAQHGGEYIPQTDPDITMAVLRNSFGAAVVPEFVSPEKIISVQLNVRGTKFSYANTFDGSVAITNNSAEPLVVSDDGLFSGNIRVDADISGDINKNIPNLISIKVRPASPIEPGRSMFVPLRLATAELRQTLLTHPQASIDIEFTAYLDPVITDQGTTNRFAGIEPARAIVMRPGVELTTKFLRNRFNSLSKGRQGQKIITAQLFTGLLAEQHAMANRQPPYKFMYADWMPALLKSGLLHNLTDDDWSVKVQTMAGMLVLPLDYELINALAENLNDVHWPTRLMAIYLLANNQNESFAKVLDWTAEYDPHKLVRDTAIALGGAAPQPQKPENQSDQDGSATTAAPFTKVTTASKPEKTTL
jgi:hypothetical protein